MDAQNWSGLTRLTEVFERLRARLVRFADQEGRELFDLPDAPRPDPGADAPPRFLGEFDNVLLGHADRRRIVPEGMTPWMDPSSGSRHVNNLLIDGMLAGSWRIEREDPKRGATLAIRTAARLSREQREQVEAEAWRLLEFAAGDAPDADVRFER
jgi:hypothetical protein